MQVINEVEILERRRERIRLCGVVSGGSVKVQRVNIIPWAGF